MFYLRIFDSFGSLVELFWAMYDPLRPFVIFMAMISALFIVLFTIVGCSFGEGATTYYPFYVLMQGF
jgi:hypothetical protein